MEHVFGTAYSRRALKTPSKAVMREVNSQVLQQLRDSVSRVSTLAQCMRDAVHREGTSGASDDLHDINTPVARVSKQVLSSDKYFNRGDSTPAGYFIAPELSCRNGTGALIDSVTVADGRGVTKATENNSKYVVQK